MRGRQTKGRHSRTVPLGSVLLDALRAHAAAFRAEQMVDAGTAAMVINIAPLIVMALAAVFLGERLTAGLLIGGAVAFAGVVVIGLAAPSFACPMRRS